MSERLNVWDWNHKYDIDAKIEEDLNDARLVMKYNDHGDDFIFVCMKDGKKYEYAWYCNRYFNEDYSHIEDGYDWAVKDFIRPPKLYAKEDRGCSLSNCLYKVIKDHIYTKEYDGWFAHEKLKKEDSAIGFELSITWIKEDFDKAYSSGIHYNRIESKKEFDEYVKLNSEYLTSESKFTDYETIEDIINDLKWTSDKIDGFDGYAGKKDRTGSSYVSGDSIEWVILNGKKLNWRALKGVKHYRPDEWGVSQFGVKVY